MNDTLVQAPHLAARQMVNSVGENWQHKQSCKAELERRAVEDET